jgi:predicted phosphodiesterase
MKIAVLADIHSNVVALETVIADIDAWRPDYVAVAGDIINRGPRPRECVERILERQQRDGWLVIRGNHERYMLEALGDPAPTTGIHAEIRASVYWMIERMGGVAWIHALEEHTGVIGPDGKIVRIMHASARHDRDNILPRMSDAELREKIDPTASVFCVGHTHEAFVRQLGTTMLVNVGSAGLPFDYDARAAYARLEWDSGMWHAQIVRVPYDLGRARRDFTTTGFLADCGATARVILAELMDARGYIADWITKYQHRVEAGELTVSESAQRLLADRG